MKPSQKERLEILQKLLFTIHLHRHLTVNESKVHELLGEIDAWVEAHNQIGKDEKTVTKNVSAAYERLRVLK